MKEGAKPAETVKVIDFTDDDVRAAKEVLRLRDAELDKIRAAKEFKEMAAEMERQAIKDLADKKKADEAKSNKLADDAGKEIN